MEELMVLNNQDCSLPLISPHNSLHFVILGVQNIILPFSNNPSWILSWVPTPTISP